MKTKIIQIIVMALLMVSLISCGVYDKMEANRIAVIDTDIGIIKLELFEDKVPITTGNFIKLAEEGFYDDTRFHRVIKNFMIQGGDPISKKGMNKAMWGTGGPDYKIEDEFVEGISNLRGTISMANSGPNTGGSQFFINVVDNIYLDFDKEPSNSKHAVFGRVIEGMDIVDQISVVKADPGSKPLEDIVVKSIKIEAPSPQ